MGLKPADFRAALRLWGLCAVALLMGYQRNWSSAQVVKHFDQWPGKKHKTTLYKACRWHKDQGDADEDDRTTELSGLLLILADENDEFKCKDNNNNKI